VKNYFNNIIGNNGLWVDLKKSNLKSFLEKAKELEKKYEWFQATEFYKKAVDLALEEKDGHSFYKVYWFFVFFTYTSKRITI
jgi:hypothetical protein